jgi:hypothetical protein
MENWRDATGLLLLCAIVQRIIFARRGWMIG